MKPTTTSGRIAADLLSLEKRKEEADKQVSAASGCLPLLLVLFGVCAFFGYATYVADQKEAKAANRLRMEAFEAEIAAWQESVRICDADPKCGHPGRAKLPSAKPKLSLANEGGFNSWIFASFALLLGIIAIFWQYTQNKEVSEKASGKIAKDKYFLGIED